jgi:hypothetical protein
VQNGRASGGAAGFFAAKTEEISTFLMAFAFRETRK